jgi:hypothetical protein
MLGATDDPCLPLARPAPKTASGGKIRARRFAPGKSAAKPLYHFRKSRFCGGTRVGHPILGSTIDRLVAGQIAAKAQGEAKDKSTGATSAAAAVPASGSKRAVGGAMGLFGAEALSQLPLLPDGTPDLGSQYPDIVVTANRQQHHGFLDFVDAIFGSNMSGHNPHITITQPNNQFALGFSFATQMRAQAMTDAVVAATSARLDAAQLRQAQLINKALSELNWGIGGFLGVTAGGAALVAGGAALLPGIVDYGPMALSYGRAGISGLGYTGSASQITGSVVAKATIGFASEWGANAMTGQNLTVSNVTGAIAASVIFAPAVGKWLPETTPLLKKLTVTGGFAGFGGNIVEQGIDFLATGRAFSTGNLAWSTGFGALGGLTGYANVKMLPTPHYINLPGSLMEDLVMLPAAAGAMPALIAQKLFLAPKRVMGR